MARRRSGGRTTAKGFARAAPSREDRLLAGKCSGAQSKCGGRAIKGTFRRTIGENIGDHERTLSETERRLGETDARSRKPDHII